ncbi:hypothetical protein DFH07DRAFT_969802 [Mycena maculata]|uniref:Uncharacterized protein n=1 Tax=Mycena maculata TaxID=230809 RepID=A0AAD7MRD0_9AGAR|nr:hypothetical protein DFH07DRAFT_969802 [Mycena maculata]
MATVIVDDHSPLVQYNPPGGWLSEGSSIEYMRTTMSSMVLGSTATFKFNGTSIAVYGTVVGPNYQTTMDFRVDRILAGFYGPAVTAVNTTTYHQLLWTSDVLVDGVHTLVITQNCSIQDRILFLDYFLYNTTSTSDETVFIDDDNPIVEYSAGWENLSLNEYFQHTAHVSSELECWVSLTFEGDFVALYGPVTVGSDGNSFNASVAIDRGSPGPVFSPAQELPPGTTTYNQLLFSSLLSPGSHTVVVTNLDGTDLYVDYFLVRASSPTHATSASVLPSSVWPSPTVNPMGGSQTGQTTKSFPVVATVGGSVGDRKNFLIRVEDPS